jgi:hypothetical protein
VTDAGAVLFARYAYPPNELGYCGPDGAAALLRADAPAEIARRARRFEGAWSYLEVIAEAAGLDDPLDPAVVEAYWVGNDLLDAVDPAALLDRLTERFRGQVGGTWRSAGGRAVAHHTFQVYEVYPWSALLSATGRATALTVLQMCRIRTGVVLAVDGATATVRTRPLAWDGHRLTRGAHRTETARWAADGLTLLGGAAPLDGPAPGDRVALHWDWVCDVLTDRQCARIEALEERRYVIRPP